MSSNSPEDSGVHAKVGRRALLGLVRRGEPRSEPQAVLPPQPARPAWQARAAVAAQLENNRPQLVARVLAFQCLARSGCSTCVEHCPTAGALALEGGVVRVQPSACDGCGRCREVCPAPQPAIELLPVLAPLPIHNAPVHNAPVHNAPVRVSQGVSVPQGASAPKPRGAP